MDKIFKSIFPNIELFVISECNEKSFNTYVFKLKMDKYGLILRLKINNTENCGIIYFREGFTFEHNTEFFKQHRTLEPTRSFNTYLELFYIVFEYALYFKDCFDYKIEPCIEILYYILVLCKEENKNTITYYKKLKYY